MKISPNAQLQIQMREDGNPKFAELMSAFITKAPGAPKLAAAGDPRPEYNALEGFTPEED